jgi:hypothetical protein
MMASGLSAIFQLDLDEGYITEVVQAVLVLVGLAINLRERFKKGGVSALGLKG